MSFVRLGSYNPMTFRSWVVDIARIRLDNGLLLTSKRFLDIKMIPEIAGRAARLKVHVSRKIPAKMKKLKKV